MHLITQDLGQRVSSQRQAFNIILGTHRHLTHRVVVQGLLTERVTFVQLSDLLVAFQH